MSEPQTLKQAAAAWRKSMEETSEHNKKLGVNKRLRRKVEEQLKHLEYHADELINQLTQEQQEAMLEMRESENKGVFILSLLSLVYGDSMVDDVKKETTNTGSAKRASVKSSSKKES